MANILGGAGLGLPYPQNLYPSELQNTANDAPSNYIALAPGDVITIPAGTWVYELGPVAVIQWRDPVTGIWRGFSSARAPLPFIRSDGYNFRLANLTGCPVSAVIAGGGSGFTQGTAAITSNVGGSLWQAIVGGSLSVSTINAAGAGYTMAPEVFIPAPPNPGIPATAIATLTNGSVSAVSLTNVGAGYVSPPKPVLVPNPADPALGTSSITQASITLVLNAAQSGAITGALCTNNGASLATLTALTLTASGGGGTGATITPLVMQAVASATIAGTGGGYGTAANPPLIMTAGGNPSAVSAIGNPAVELTGFRPRPAVINVTSSSVGALSAPVITDPGLFVAPATPIILNGAGITTTVATVTLVMGGVNDSVLLQPV